MKTPEEVMQAIRKDELYYLATNGGITFGGGEPLLRAFNKSHIVAYTFMSYQMAYLKAHYPYESSTIMSVSKKTTEKK